MLLSLTTTHRPATDLGFLLEKHPARCQRFELSFGLCHVFYPEATADRCTAALLLDLDPVGLVRGRRGSSTLEAYVNDRPYVASSFLSVAIAQVFGSALNGRSRERPELAATPIPMQVELSAVRCRGGLPLVRRLFEPLGYTVSAEAVPLDATFPEWGPSPYYSLRLETTQCVSAVLAHLYVLIPVLDDDKHYYVGDDEVEKLLYKGQAWLATHPERELVASRYLRYQGGLTRDALARLVADEEADRDAIDDAQIREEEAVESKLSLNELRLRAVAEAVEASGARTVVDLGCGEGKLVRALASLKKLTRVVGMDVSLHALDRASRRLHLDSRSEQRSPSIELHQGSLGYRDARLAGFDAACAVEVIEHIDAERVPELERTVFEFARPKTVIVTTPNVEYNVRFEGLGAGRLRHRDHRFEWTRAEFRSWAERVAARFGYEFEIEAIGDHDDEVGAPTQMAVFTR